MKRVYIYTRVSSVGQADNTSLEMQKEKCRAFCMINDYEVIEIVEEVMSGKNVDDREGLKRILDDVNNGGADGLVVLRLDRLARHTLGVLQIAEEFLKNGKTLAIVELSIDTSTPAGKMVLTMMAAVAEMERACIRQRCADGRAAKKAAGGRIGGRAPYGYKVDGEELIEIPEQITVITEMQTLRNSGMAFGKIADALNERGIAAQSGKKWYATTVSNVLENQL